MNMRSILRRARHGDVRALCHQRVLEALELARQARDQGFPNAVREYVNEAREYRRIARQEVGHT
jgi:hypothetical protein